MITNTNGLDWLTPHSLSHTPGRRVDKKALCHRVRVQMGTTDRCNEPCECACLANDLAVASICRLASLNTGSKESSVLVMGSCLSIPEQGFSSCLNQGTTVAACFCKENHRSQRPFNTYQLLRWRFGPATNPFLKTAAAQQNLPPARRGSIRPHATSAPTGTPCCFLAYGTQPSGRFPTWAGNLSCLGPGSQYPLGFKLVSNSPNLP